MTGKMTADEHTTLLKLGEQVVDLARKAGVDVAEAYVRRGAHLSTKIRLQKPELVEEAGSTSVGLRVIADHRSAVTYTSDLTSAGLARFVQDAVELVQLSQPDEYAAPPDPALLSSESEHKELHLYDPSLDEVDAAEALQRAARAEQAALDTDPRVQNSEGAQFTRTRGAGALVTSGGFRGFVRGTYGSLSVSPVLDDADGKKRSGVYWTARRWLHGLEDEGSVGRKAAHKTLAKLGARKIPTQQVAVIFDPEVGRSIVGLVASCVSGGAIWRKSSYLVDREHTSVASSMVTLVDDPWIAKAPGSRPYDGEGLLSRTNVVVEQGVLKTYLLDSYSARKLSKHSTASASRSGSGGVGVSTTNFFMQPGAITAEQLIASTPKALYVTDLMGFGFNPVTGDFSRGAAGFWVENGELTYPVSEVTISLNLNDLLHRIDAIASDLDLRTSIAAPTFRVREMTVAGS
jgi:PmbA protein